MKFDVQLVGLEKFEARAEKFPKVARRAAMLAINTTARNARAEASREIRRQVRLTRAYLNRDGRLEISNRATETFLSSSISARKRPTSLVTFGAKQLFRRGKTKARVNAGVSVQIKRSGARRKLRSAFFVKLRSGNVGVAVRSLEGLNKKSIRASKKSAGIYTLYGPSVDQVFTTVRNDISPKWSSFLAREFDRNYARLL